MRKSNRRAARSVLLGLLALSVLGSSALPAQPDPIPPAIPPAPAVPDPPAPLPPPDPPAGGEINRGAGFRVPKGATHRGDVYRIRGTVDIEGTLEGDLSCLAGTVNIPGKVTGDVYAAGSRVEITGSVGDSARILAGEVVIDGRLDGDLIVSGDSIRLGPEAVVNGSVQIYAKNATVEGEVASDLFVRAGVLDLRGKVGGDADVEVEKINLAPGARIVGDLKYSSRAKLALEGSPQVGGMVTYEGRPEATSKKSTSRSSRSGDSDNGGLPGRIFRFIAAFLTYAVTIRMARNVVPHVQAAAADSLQSAGVGFIALLTPFAALITMIGIVTIPLVIVYLLLWIVAFYLSGIAPALWLGRFALGKLNRPGASIYAALALGLAILYIAYGVPFLGWIVWSGATLWGLGALILGGRNYWTARRAAPPPAPPPADPPPAAEPPTTVPV